MERRDVKKFLTRITAVVAAVLLICLALIVVTRDGDSYGAAMLLKMHRAHNAPSPRLFIVGGSALAFGIDSQLIEQDTGLHPVNLGLYSTYGIDYLLAQVDSVAKPGDTILLIPEYDVLDSPPSATGFLVWEAMQINPTLSRFAFGDVASWISLVRAFPVWLSTRVYSFLGHGILEHFVPLEDTLYRRVYKAHNFNEYGDLSATMKESYTLPHSEIESALPVFPGGGLNDAVVAHIAAFIESEKKKDITVLFSYPAVPQSLYNAHKEELEDQSARIATAIGTSTIVGTQQEFVFDDNLFFDTVNHLGAKGRTIRTNLLVTALLSSGSLPK